MKRIVKVIPYAIWLFILIGIARVMPMFHWRPQARVLYEAWGWASACTAEVPDQLKNPLGDLDHIWWGTFRPGALDDSLPGHIIGLTVNFPEVGYDSIYIDEAHQDSVWVIAHELVHHILIADSTVWGHQMHPFFPFAFPCHLLYFQQPGAAPVGG